MYRSICLRMSIKSLYHRQHYSIEFFLIMLIRSYALKNMNDKKYELICM